MQPSDYIKVIELGEVDEIISPIVYSIPLQLLAYHVALIIPLQLFLYNCWHIMLR